MSEPDVEHGVVVFAVWAVCGPAGLGFVLQGMADDRLLVGLLGVAAIAAGLVGHVIANAVFRRDFGAGAVALGLSAMGVLALVLVLGWIGSRPTAADLAIAFALVLTLLGAFLLYLATRFGLRGAFSRFHLHAPGPPR